MCRHLAYLGPPVALHGLLFDAPHSLCAEARTPRHQDTGDTNPDGWGVGWYPPGDDRPRVHRTVTPVWDDHAFATDARALVSGAFVAAARLASPGSAIAVTGNAPFLVDGWLFSLNGIVRGFHDGVSEQLRRNVSARRRVAIEGDTDSEVLFAMVLDRLDAGAAPASALADVVRHVLTVTTGRINLLLADGQRVAATRSGRSLFARRSLVASEPVDDDASWQEVPDGSVVTLDGDPAAPDLRIEPL